MAYRKVEQLKESDEIIYGADLFIGEQVVLDKNKPNNSVVTIVEFSPRRMFSVVRNNDDRFSWTVVTKRLTKNKF